MCVYKRRQLLHFRTKGGKEKDRGKWKRSLLRRSPDKEEEESCFLKIRPQGTLPPPQEEGEGHCCVARSVAKRPRLNAPKKREMYLRPRFPKGRKWCRLTLTCVSLPYFYFYVLLLPLLIAGSERELPKSDLKIPLPPFPVAGRKGLSLLLSPHFTL